MANINLIPQNQLKAQAPNHSLMLGLIFAIIAVAAMFGGFFIFGLVMDQNKKQAEADKLVVMREKESYADVSADAKLLQKQLSSLKTVLDKHIYWSQLLWNLEDRTLKTVSISSFSAAVPGQVELEAVAPQYGEVAKQIQAYIQDPFFASYRLNRASLAATADGKTKVVFSLSLQLANDALLQTDQQLIQNSQRSLELTVPVVTPATTPTVTAVNP